MKKGESMAKRRKAKFKVGSVVIRRFPGETAEQPIKVESRCLHLQGSTGKEGWLYEGQGRTAWENTLRPLTKKERG